MSGQIVGEVIDAAEAGHLDDLSSNAFDALIVIADRAHTDTRQGSVRAGRIAAAIRRPNAPWTTTAAASQSTVERAIKELKGAGWVSVVKRGFNNNHGRAQAPVYEVAPFPSSMVTETVTSAPVVQGDGNGEAFPSNHRPFPSNGGGVPVTQGDDLTVFPDGSLDGGSAREAEPAPSQGGGFADDPPKDQPTPEPPRRCPKHVNWDTARHGKVPDCPGCRDAREAHKRWQADSKVARADREAAVSVTKDEIQQAVEDCDDCDGFGRLDDLSDCPKHTNLRRFRAS